MIVGGRLRAVVEDMARTLTNTAHSPRISIRRQFGCALLDEDANVVSADNPRYVAALGDVTRHCIDAFRFDLSEDDVLLTNDPYGGTPSVHYFTVVAPVKLGPDSTGYVAVIAHLPDIGGWVMGNYHPRATELRAEGTRFSPMKIIKFGRRRRDVLETLYLNSRLPTTFEGDVNGMLAALFMGRREFGSLATRHGVDGVRTAMDAAIAYTELRTRQALSAIPDGRHEGRATLQGADRAWRIEVQLERRGDLTRLDFSSADKQAPMFFNCTPSTARTQAITPLLGLLGEDIPWNSGIFDAVEFELALGSVLNPEYPAPTGWSIEHLGCEVAEAVRQALAIALPDGAGPGLPSRDLAYTVHKERRVGSVEEQLRFTDLSVLAQPGSGAASAVDGWGNPGAEALGQLPSVEEFEQESDFLVESMEYRRDSGGAGAARGGPGTTTVIAFPSVCFEHLYTVSTSIESGPPGVRGGRSGGAGQLALGNAEDEAAPIDSVSFNLPVAASSILRIDAPGGGGYGDPRDRPLEAVQADVLDGLVSASAARAEYGVELEPVDALAAEEGVA